MYRINQNADLTKLTTFGIPAGCGCLVEYDNLSDLRSLAEEHPSLLNGKVFNLGGGSNLLFVNGFFPGTVLRCVGKGVEELPTLEQPTEKRLRVQAGMTLDELVDYTATRGLWGLENLAAIPGCVGGAAVQNVGAYGAEFSQSVVKVKAFDLDTLSTVEYPVENCEYGYRTSVFKTSPARLAIYEVEVALSTVPAPRLGYAGIKEAIGDIAEENLTPVMIAEAVRRVRAAKLPDPAEVGSAGSYFKNPVIPAGELPTVEAAWKEFCERTGTTQLPLQYHMTDNNEAKLSAAWLIDKSGCREFRVGGASLWPTQPLVIVNREGTADYDDVIGLQRMVQQRVEEAFKVRLTPEVVRVGGSQQ